MNQAEAGPFTPQRFAALSSSVQNDTTVTDVTSKTDLNGREGRLISAFFGLDDAMPGLSDFVVCDGAGGQDGLPVIFSHEIDVTTMQAGDFKVTTASGEVGYVHCVTLAPADDAGEHRTALLVGAYGSAGDQPAKIEIVGNVLSLDGTVNFKGTAIVPIALEEGPTMVIAEVIPGEALSLEKEVTGIPFGGGSGCPIGTVQAVNVVWTGGVTKPGGDEADDLERQQYRVTLSIPGTPQLRIVTPFALADLGDGDNNHKLCLDTEGTPTSVSFPAGYLTDPRDDANPATTVEVGLP